MRETTPPKALEEFETMSDGTRVIRFADDCELVLIPTLTPNKYYLSLNHGLAPIIKKKIYVTIGVK